MDFFEALHEGKQMLDGDDLSGSMVEPVVDFLRGHDDIRFDDLRFTISKLSLVVI